MAYQKHDRKAYNYFVLDFLTNKILTGWEYKKDAQEYISERDQPNEDLKVYTRSYLSRVGVDPKDNASWGSELGLVSYKAQPEIVLAGDFRKDIQIPEVKLRFNKGKSFGKISNSDDVYNFLLRVYGRSITLQEHFVLLLLDNGLNIMGYYKHTIGTPVATLADVPMLMGIVLKSLARSFIISHNHPSDSNWPSEADKKLTLKIKQASISLDINMLDHVIVTKNKGYYSFADDGALGGLSYNPHKGTMDLVTKLRQEVFTQLKKVHQHPELTPELYQIIKTQKGYHWAENRIIDLMISDGITVSAAIPQIEAEL